MAKTLEEENRELRARVAELEALAYIDPLTGLKNRRAFDDELAREIARTNRDGMPVVLLLVDVNDMKSWNDEAHDHGIGDRALVTVADALTQSTREVDLVCRTGGDEFAMILHGANLAGAAIVAARVISRLLRSPILVRTERRVVQISIGGTTISGTTAAATGLRERAEKYLYDAKQKKSPSVSPIVIR